MASTTYCEVCDMWMGKHRYNCPVEIAQSLAKTFDALAKTNDTLAELPFSPDIPLLTFGRHRNRLISEVLEDDPGWLVWAYETVRGRAGIDRKTYLAALKRREGRKPKYRYDPPDYPNEDDEYPEGDRWYGDLD